MRAYSSAHFGAGSGPIFLDDVQCSSSSNQLLECSSRPILTHGCSHSEDAGVGCEGKLKLQRQMELFSNTTGILDASKVRNLQVSIQLADMGSCDWWEAVLQMRAEWSSV